MVNHPNRSKPEASTSYVVQQISMLLAESVKLMDIEPGSEEFERARKRAWLAARQTGTALKMMAPDAAAPTK